MTIHLEDIEAAIDVLNERIAGGVDSDDCLKDLGVDDTDLFRTYVTNRSIETLHDLLPGFPVETYLGLNKLLERGDAHEMEMAILLISIVTASWTEGFSAALKLMPNQENH